MEIENALCQFCEYQQFIRGFSKTTITRYKTAVRFFAKTENAATLQDCTEARVRHFMMYGRTDRGWNANSFITFHKSLYVFFRWCAAQHYMETNPAAEIEMPKLEKKIPVKLTRQQAERILETAYNMPYPYKFLRYRNHAIFGVFIFAGLRKQELLGLKYADVDLENRSIFVRQGKGAKDRIVPICATLADTLQRYLKERQRLNKTCPEFFASLNRNIGFTAMGLRGLVRKMNSGVKFSAHKLRHTFATLMLEGGCDIYSLSRMMGHSNIKTTTIYLAASAEHLRSQITKHPLDEKPTYNAL